MKILDRLPISDRPHVITVGEDAVQVNRNQVIVWVSINDVLRPFPAILDTTRLRFTSTATSRKRPS